MSETDSRVINYLAFRQDEIHGPTAQPGIGALILAHAVLVIQPGVFPIADTNTLVPDYYAQVNALDTRYAADLEREHYIGAFEDLAARDENVPGELVGMFETCVFEPKFLAMYFGSEDPDKGRPEAVDYFFNRYNVSTNDEVLAIISHAAGQKPVWLVRPVVDQVVTRLGAADAMIVELLIAVDVRHLVAGRLLVVPRIEKSLVVVRPRDVRELDPLQRVGEIARVVHIANAHLPPI